MNPSRKRSLVAVAATALLAVSLVAPTANAAAVPPLATTAQYKALLGFVDKLDKLSSTPATSAQKAVFDGQLENKHGAAVSKSTALFNRGKRAAQAESQHAFKTGSRTIRRTEAGNWPRCAVITTRGWTGPPPTTRTRWAGSKTPTTAGPRRCANRSAACGSRRPTPKASCAKPVEEAIDRRVKRGTENRKLEQEEIADLKAGYQREKDAIRSAKASATRVVQQNDDEAIDPAQPRQPDLQHQGPHAAERARQPAPRSRRQAQRRPRRDRADARQQLSRARPAGGPLAPGSNRRAGPGAAQRDDRVGFDRPSRLMG